MEKLKKLFPKLKHMRLNEETKKGPLILEYVSST